MARKSRKRSASRNVSRQRYTPGLAVAIISLVLNILLPGVGSLLAGRVRAGIWQLALVAAGTVMYELAGLSFIGLLLIVVSFIWGVYTAISVIKNTQ